MAFRLKNRLKQYALLFLLAAFPLPSLAETELLRLLVWEGYAPKEQREQFKQLVKEKYDVDLEISIRHIQDTEHCYRALQLKQADILSPSHNRINDKRHRMIDRGLLLPLDLNNIPNYGDLKDEFREMAHLVDKGKTYGTAFAWGPYGLIYNADVIDEPPTSWNALWDPRYQNQYTVADLGEYNAYITALALGYSEEKILSFNFLLNRNFRNKLGKLANGSNGFWRGVDSLEDMDGMVLATSWGFSLPALQRNGKNWKWAKLAEKSPVWIDNFVISHTLKDKPRLKRIAEEWINFTLTPQYQAQVLVKGIAAQPVNSKASGLLPQETIEAFSFGEADPKNQRFFLTPELSQSSRKGVDHAWNMALRNLKISKKK